MKTLILIIKAWLHRRAARLRERWYLRLELIALRHQVEVLKRSAKRPRFEPADRWLWGLLSRGWPEWPQALEIMKADTVKRWRRQGLRHHLRWRRGRKRPGRPPIPSETHQLIREMSRDNRLWGAPRIRGELIKLGITVSQTTVAKYMDRRPGLPSPTWRAFWRMHAPDLPVREVYAELAGRTRAISTRILGIVPTLYAWLWGWVSIELRQRIRCHVGLTPLSATQDLRPEAGPLRGDGLIQAFGRSPPDSLWSSIDRVVPAYPPCETERSQVRLVSSTMKSWEASPQAIFAPPAIKKTKSPNVSRRTAA